MQTEEGRWRVEFDEPWAREGAKPPEGEDPARRGRRGRGRAAGRGAPTRAGSQALRYLARCGVGPSLPARRGGARGGASCAHGAAR